MSRQLAALAILCAFAPCLGCGGRDYPGDQRFPLSGNVTVDGQILEIGVISFIPQDKKSGRVAGAPIKDGKYTVPEPKGATSGKYRVEIHWNKPTGRQIQNPFDPEEKINEMQEGLPPKYHKNSELTAEVSENQTTFDFDLKAESK